MKVVAFIDQKAECDDSKWRVFYDGIPVISYKEYKKCDKWRGIPIITDNSYYSVNWLIKDLESDNLKEWEDFYVWHKYKTLRDVYEKDLLCIELIEMPITEKCTLNCKKCSFLTPYYKTPRHIKIDKLVESIDAFFSVVDSVNTFRILGGEPFIYPDLQKLLEYLFENYSHKFKTLLFLSNGTVLPSNTVLEYMSNHKDSIRIGISDYTMEVPYSEKLSDNLNVLDEYKIRYSCSPLDKWVDLVFPEKINKVTRAKAAERFFLCGHHCRTLYDEKLWQCAFERSAYSADLCDAVEYYDYIELNESSNCKRRFLEFYWGYSKEACNSLCYFCEMPDVNWIKAAEQMSKRG